MKESVVKFGQDQQHLLHWDVTRITSVIVQCKRRTLWESMRMYYFKDRGKNEFKKEKQQEKNANKQNNINPQILKPTQLSLL